MGYTNASAILSCGVIIANLGVKFDLSVGMFEAAERAKSQTFVGFSTICIEVTEQYGKPIVFVSIPNQHAQVVRMGRSQSTRRQSHPFRHAHDP
jgi:hypothetical protein